MKILGVDRGSVIVLRSDSDFLHFPEDHDRAVSKRWLREVRSLIGRQRKRHGKKPLQKS